MSLPKRQKIIIFSLLLLVLTFAFAAVDARELENTYPKLPGIPEPLELTSNTTLPDLLNYLFSFLILISGIIAFASVVFAGFMYMNSGANPGLRAEAQKRLKSVLMGLALLFGIYLILNTINPELVQLYTPGEGPTERKQLVLEDPKSPFGVGVNLETLKYGGIIIFDAESTDGSSGKSEAIFHESNNLRRVTNLAQNKPKAIKILGDCAVDIFTDPDYQGPFINVSATANPLPSSYKNEVESLRFTNDTCLGHSIKVFERPQYNRNADDNADGSMVFVDSDLNLSDRDFVLSYKERKVEDNISSIRFAIETAPEPVVTFCAMRGLATGEEGCQEISSSVSTLDGNPIDDKISSLNFTTTENRQAGVVVYEHPKFGARQETFIASDSSMDTGSFVQHDVVSSIKIIGRYRVTLYEHNDFIGNWIQIDNIAPEQPEYTVNYAVGNDNDDGTMSSMQVNDLLPEEYLSRGIIQISDLRDETRFCIKYNDDTKEQCQETFNDSLNSIKLELPFSIVAEQRLIAPSLYQSRCGSGSPELDDFCVL